MKTVRPWVEALGISEDDYQRWCSAVPADESVTFRCLREGRIPVEAYLTWAKDFYETPVLQSDFFKESPNQSLFEKLKTIAPWSREMFPLAEWDGVVYVGCTEPNEELRWSFHVCYVLASPVDLENHWNALNGVAKPQASAPTFNDDRTPFPQAPKVPVPSASAAAVAPIAKEADPFASLEQELTKTAVPSPTPAAGVDTPAGLEVPEGLAGFGSFADSSTVSSAQSADAPAGLAAPVMTAPSTEAQAHIPEGLSLPTLPELPENTVTSIFPKVDDIVAHTGLSQANTSIQAVAKEQFTDLKSNFSHSMLLVFEGEILKPLAWTDNWTAPSAGVAPVSLSGPSAFRVAYRTKMPYLGHVVETPTNVKFFTEWSHPALPENALIQPLLENGKWHGMLLLLTTKDKKQQMLLTSAEQAATRFIDLLSKSAKPQAA